MNDLISRQAAIDAFWQLDIEIRPSAINAITKMLMNLPSAQPKAKEGEWIYTSDQSGYIGDPVEKCSICGVEYEQAPFNYCPNCGAEMKGRE